VGTRRRRELAIILVVYSAFLAVVLLAPTSGTQSESASWLSDLALSLGVPDRFTSQPRIEFVCNALILMPVSALGSLVWPRTTWRDWTAYAFVISGFVELIQGLVLPQRTATFVDVVANTLGGLGGAVVVMVVRRLTVRRTGGGR
jgi:glycopeptide antibiotics resistance protein